MAYTYLSCLYIVLEKMDYLNDKLTEEQLFKLILYKGNSNDSVQVEPCL
jgi:hypothetical protein